MPPIIGEMIGALQAGDTAAASELQVRIWFDGPERDKSRFSQTLQEARRLASAMNLICVERNTFFNRITSYNVCYTKLLRPPLNASREYMPSVIWLP